jgi:hypothetical protein
MDHFVRPDVESLMGASALLIKTGVQMIEGRPGSGKSFFLVRECAKIVLQDARPIYTNLPLKWRVFERYLKHKGGERTANLLHPLTREHFHRFCVRQQARQEFREKLKRMRRPGEPFLSRAELDRRWYDHAGPDITRGDEANWIPACAVVCIDEAHHWYPQSSQGKGDDLALLAYTTMHRHHMHLVLVASQSMMQVSLSIRRQAQLWWNVRDIRDEKLAWGFKFGHFGIRGMRYECQTPEMREGTYRETDAVERFIVFPQLPWYQDIFRLYEPFTHVGSRRVLASDLRAARLDAGLSVVPVRRDEGGIVRKSTKRLLSWIGKWTRRIVLASVFVAVGGVSACVFKGRPAAVAGGVAAATSGDAGTGGESVSGPFDGLERYGALSGVSRRVARFGAESWRVGENVNGWRLVACNVRNRGALVYRDGAVWLWRVGAERPELVGPLALVLDRVRAYADSAGSSDVVGPGEGAAGALGAEADQR